MSRPDILNFIRAKESSTHSSIAHTVKTRPSTTKGSGKLTGIEARSFYESVVASSSTAEDSHVQPCQSHTSKQRTETHPYKSRRKSKSNETNPHSLLNNRINNKFLQFAQDGNLAEVRRLVRDGSVDIDTQDQFDWTALMCAAHQGHQRVVQYLMKKGATLESINSQGKTAVELAQLSGHTDIVELFHSYAIGKRSSSTSQHSEPGQDHKVKPWCSVCQEEFVDKERKHRSSTVHQFNCKHNKPQRGYYYIGEDNPGYKLMVKAGWDPTEGGLGPEGLGRKYPVKTVLKRDRLGLGSVQEEKQARVTHFGPNDKTAVKRKKYTSTKEAPRTTTKKEKLSRDMKDKMWERDMRIYMSTD